MFFSFYIRSISLLQLLNYCFVIYLLLCDVKLERLIAGQLLTTSKHQLYDGYICYLRHLKLCLGVLVVMHCFLNIKIILKETMSLFR